MINLDNWHKEYIKSRNEFEQQDKAHAEDYISSLSSIQKFFLENFWVTKQSARYEAAWGYLKQGE